MEEKEAGVMGSMRNLFYYVEVIWRDECIARWPTNEMRSSDHDLGRMIPLLHSQFTYTINQRMFVVLKDVSATFCAVVDEALGKRKALRFLEQVRDEFTLDQVSSTIVYPYRRIDLMFRSLDLFAQIVEPLVGIPEKQVDIQPLELQEDDLCSTLRSPAKVFTPCGYSLYPAVLQMRNAVGDLAKMLVSEMHFALPRKSDCGQRICDEVGPTVSGWMFLVEAFVCDCLFSVFGSGKNYSKKWPKLSYFAPMDFIDSAATISNLLARGSADTSSLGDFCFRTFKSIFGHLPTFRGEDWDMVARRRHPKSVFYQCFLEAAVSSWLVHRLAHLYRLQTDEGTFGWKTYPKGSKVRSEFMEPVVDQNSHSDTLDFDRVGFVVFPGFQLHDTMIFKCEFYPLVCESSPNPIEGTSVEDSEPSPACKPNDCILEDVVKKYTWNHVLQMTNNLSTRQLGKGGFGTVYLGKLETRREVAVKIRHRSSHQGISEFVNEVNLLRRVNHVNLVRLLGFCPDEEQVLIYEFAEEESIWDHLHGDRKWLDWKQRLSIALQSACGLEYLHTMCNPRILHRDIKSENILWTKTIVAKVAAFGSSRLGADEVNRKTHITTKVMGTRGYIDPEYHLTGQLRDSSDVFSFGVVLLEIITGRKPVPNQDPKCAVTKWVAKTYGSGGSKGVKAVADPLFSDNYNPKALKLVINLALSCTNPSGESRPKISEVVRVLRGAQTLELGEKKSWLPFL